jgi:tight adherence protein B
MDYMFYFLTLLIFVAVVLLLEGALLTWNTYKGPEATRLERRLRTMSAGEHAGGEEYNLVKKRMLSNSPPLDRLLFKIPRIHLLDRLLEQSGMGINLSVFLGFSLACALIGLLIPGYFGAPLIIALPIGVLFGLLPFMNLQYRRSNRLKIFEQQLPEALDTMSRALRAGHALPNAIKMISEEMADPIASEFRIVFDEVNFGFSMQDALLNLATRVPMTDLRYFVIAVLIQRETGGNLAELLGNISALIRARLKLLATVRVLSAEGRLSAWILTLLPFALGFVINMINPDFMKILWEDTGGQKMVGVAAVMMVVGIFWMRKIVRIHV